MTNSKTPLRSRPLVVAALCILLLMVAGTGILVRYWPFSQKSVRAALPAALSADLIIGRFHTTYFPHPGCVLENILFRPNPAAGSKPRFTVLKITLQANYWDMLVGSHHIYRVLVQGLQVHLPALHSGDSSSGPKFSFGNSKVTIGEIIATESMVEVERSSAPALRFDIHEFTLGSVGGNSAMSYQLAMHNPEPPGEIRVKGPLGPWQADKVGQTPLSGSYTFDQADLSSFSGIAGFLSSKGKFSGALNRIAITGHIDVPEFEVTKSHHPVHLAADFTSLVDATNGDVHLQDVNASFLRTHVNAKGDIVSEPGLPRKLTTLDVAVADGRIEDVLWLFVTKKHSPMSGVTNFQAHVVIPPQGRPFVREVRLIAEFGVGGGQFQPKTQQKIDKLSDTSRGEEKKDNANTESATEDVIADLKGHVDLQNGVAKFSGLSFTVPGAAANLQGTYNLLDSKIDFHGTLKMDAKLPQTTTGVKSLFAKAFAPMFDKKKGSVIPVVIDGTFSQPHFGIDLDPLPKK
jgi:AsmA-like C-terminal region